MKRLLKWFGFTMVELLVAMVVFSILILTMFELFAQVNEIWNTTRARVEIYEKARLFMEVVTRDLEGFVQPATPGYQFYAEYLNKSNAKTRETEKFCFAAATRLRPSTEVSSKICEVEYYYDKTKGRVYYRLIGDDQRNQKSGGWNVLSSDPTPENPFDNGKANFWNPRTGGDASGQYVELVDCVTRFRMFPYVVQDAQGALAIPRAKPDALTPLIIGIDNGIGKEYYYDKMGIRKEILFPMPEFVRVELGVMDGESWKRYKRLKTSNPEKADEIYKNNARNFVRIINLSTGRNPLDITKLYRDVK